VAVGDDDIEIEADPRESRYELPPVEWPPSAGDAEKAEAIRGVVQQAERERAAAGPPTPNVVAPPAPKEG
jgi:hypothetical protein